MLSAAVVIVVLRRGTGCELPAPTISLPAGVRSLGIAASPIEPGNDAGLEEAAQQMAQASDRTGLLNTTALPPLREHAVRADRHDATVVALRVEGDTQRHVAALAIFLDDCAHRHYFSSLANLTQTSGSGQLPGTFPRLSMDDAASRLQITQPQLSYVDDPAAPVWRDPGGGESIPAT
ncbi:MAG: hypothetical protein ACR2GX_05460 [Candidatus Dormibacteria bacterium]